MAVGEYDLNGNIKYLSRLTPGLSGLEYLDNLEYLYIGNQLTVVEEIGSTTTDYMHDFKNQSTSNGISTPEYFYDANGNMIQDLNKEIQVTYNHLNLPEEIIFEEFSGINLIDYLYDGNGRKLSKKVYNRGAINNESSADYVANYIYNPQGNLEKVLTDDGIVDVSLGNQYQYFLKDHLGNNRIMFTKNNMTEELEILQENHYYPFGMKFAGNFLNNSNKLLYNGKELQDDGFEVSRTTGTEFRYLDWYDYGARFYDAQIGRWHSVDPMAHMRVSLTPYNFCSLNPINRVDPNGALDDWVETPEGEKKYDENIHSAKDMKEKGIEGKYLGKTYKEGDNYYSLFGQVKNLKTMEGKLYEKIDQTLTNYANYIKEHDQNAWEEPIERSADFNIGVPFKKNAFGYSDYNDYTFSYEGATGYYQVYGDPSAMRGKLDWGKDTYSGNKNYGFGNMKSGYNTHIYVSKSPRLDIITLVFPTLNSKKTLYNKWKNEFFPDKK